jgi:hypothetical protein
MAYLKENLAEEPLARTPNPEEENRCVDRREKRTIKPSSTLRDELGNLAGRSG